MSAEIHQKIKSFVMRAGKLTQGQKRAMEDLFPQFRIENHLAFDVFSIFGNNNPVCLDIGFGNGESLIHIAQLYPNINFIGIEVHTPGIGHLLINIEKNRIENIRVYQGDSVEIITNCFKNDTLDHVHIYFPDPWHKKRHHKRRLIQRNFIQLIKNRLRNHGRLHLATDWQEYALHMQDILLGFPEFNNNEPNNGFSKRPLWRPVTKFERRGIKLGYNSYDLIYHLEK